MDDRRPVPPGYTCFERAGARVVTLEELAPAVAEAMGAGTLYEYARRHPNARGFTGRGIAYAVPLPGDAAAVVIRHSRHGGLLAPITGDRFLGGTRAPAELAAALRLARAGVPTPEIVAYAIYPAGGAFRRADVATREIPNGCDLASALARAAAPAHKQALLAATARLLARLSAAGARHPDLNLTNVLVTQGGAGTIEASLLDVDRVRFDRPSAAAVSAANLRRFNRSARKLRRTRGVAIDEADLRTLVAMVHGVPPDPV